MERGLAPGEVVIITGAPGSGKSTITRRLARAQPSSVHLESDWFFRFIESGFVAPHLGESHAQNLVVIDAVADAAIRYASGGYVVFWDGIVGPWFLDRITERLHTAGIGVHYVVLRAPTDVIVQRVRRRDGSIETAAVETMDPQFRDLGALETHVVDTAADVSTVTIRCQTALDSGGLLLTATTGSDPRWPVSVKGVLGWDDKVVVLRNERGEWELPGGRLEADDPDPQAALKREIEEELGIHATIGALVDSWIYTVDGRKVLVLTYRCDAPTPARLIHSDEHSEVALFTADQLADAPLPDGYLASIRRADS